MQCRITTLVRNAQAGQRVRVLRILLHLHSHGVQQHEYQHEHTLLADHRSSISGDVAGRSDDVGWCRKDARPINGRVRHLCKLTESMNRLVLASP